MSPRDRVFIGDTKNLILENLIIIQNYGDDQVIIKQGFRQSFKKHVLVTSR